MIRLKDVHFGYGRTEPVLQGAECSIPAGLTLLLGPNGAGKSTLLKIMAGIERPDRGAAALEGFDLWKDEIRSRTNLAYVSEQPDLTPYATVKDVINLVCRLRRAPVEQGSAALEKAGLGNISRRSIRELSQGQRRRAVLAAAWVGDPKIVILDEPLEAMDRMIRSEILSWMDRLLERGAAVVVATHDIEPFVKNAARALSVLAGRCRVFDPLPETPDGRMKLFENLSRGVL
jgi:ABC-type multidrug transport system ATPase subunit